MSDQPRGRYPAYQEFAKIGLSIWLIIMKTIKTIQIVNQFMEKRIPKIDKELQSEMCSTNFTYTCKRMLFFKWKFWIEQIRVLFYILNRANGKCLCFLSLYMHTIMGGKFTWIYNIKDSFL